jgi:hypothetical protein
MTANERKHEGEGYENKRKGDEEHKMQPLSPATSTSKYGEQSNEQPQEDQQRKRKRSSPWI